MRERGQSKTILVLGAYGLIGAHVVRALIVQGHEVCGLGRSGETAARVLPGVAFIQHDLAELTRPEAWAPLVTGYDYVVNCAGALQAGGQALDAVHHHSIAALAQACAKNGTGVIQVSAAGADLTASTAFMRTKAEGDGAIEQSGAAYWILRPTLVLAPGGYGGTLLLRMLAAVPFVQPVAMAQARIQTVSVFDVAAATCAVVAGDVAAGCTADLTEDEAQSLEDLLAAYRQWLGFPVAAYVVQAPEWAVALAARGADGLGALGWRSPLRSTAIAVLRDGVRGDPAAWQGAWQGAGGAQMSALAASLQAMPARAEDRLAARMALLMPLVIATLCLFWLVSGVVGLVQLSDAAQVLQEAGWSRGLARASVIGFSFADIALALAVIYRPTAKRALWGMIGLSLAYLGFASVITPEMWADPLGPLTKVVPAIVLALLARVMVEDR